MVARSLCFIVGQPEAPCAAGPAAPPARMRTLPQVPGARASRLVHEAAPTGRGLLAQVAVAAASVQLDGAAVVLTVLALLLRGAHEAAQKVPWKQRRVRAAPTGAHGGPTHHGCAPRRSPRGPPGGPLQRLTAEKRPECPSVGTRLGRPENPEEASLNSVADDRGKQREGRRPPTVTHGHVRSRGAPTWPCPKGAVTADASLLLI